MKIPEKLTIRCILNILSADDKTTLENKVWDERAESSWLGLTTETWGRDHDFRLVLAKSGDEAMIKLFEEEFFDIDDLRCITNYRHSVRISHYTKDIPIWAYIDIIYDELYHKYDRKFSFSEILPDKYEITRLSGIKVLT